MKHGGLAKSITLLVLAASMLIPAFGCASADTTAPSVTDATGTPAPTTASLPESSEPAGRPAAASGVLRLWWSKRLTLNPLLDASESGQAASKLVFQGLFAIGSDQQARPELAGSLTQTDDAGLVLQIELAADRQFHDGSPVTADDVKACIDFILANPASPYAGGLSGIASTEAIDNRTLRLTLAQPDPWLTYALTFPVIPAASLAAQPFDLIPGTGLFRMAAYSKTDGLTLTRAQPTDDPSALQQVRLLEFTNLNAAMRAFESDQIDLVFLPPDVYSHYLLRDSLRFEQYVSNQAVFLAYNTKGNSPLADGSRLQLVKSLLTASCLTAAGSGAWGDWTDVPYALDSYLLAGTAISLDEVFAGVSRPEWPADSADLALLIPEGDSMRADLAAIVSKALEQAGIGSAISVLPAADFGTALRDGDYDLAVLSATLPDEPDPSWLYGDTRPAAYAGLGEIAGPGLENYTSCRERLYASVTLAALRPPDSSVLPDNLSATAASAPWSMMLIRSAAVLYGDRVLGQSTPNRYNPYQGIEELWIWSGHSS